MGKVEVDNEVARVEEDMQLVFKSNFGSDSYLNEVEQLKYK